MNKLSKNIAKVTAAVAGVVALGTIATTTTANADSIYTVQSGDTLSGISYKLGHDLTLVETLPSANTANQTSSAAASTSAASQSQAQSQQTASASTQAQTATATTSASNAASYSNYTSSVSGNDAAAKAWIAARESGGSYSAQNGQYIGKYQLSASYLNGDYSAANQERVADQYVASRYGSWSAAQSFWQSHGWY